MIPPKKRDTNSLMACISSLQSSLHLSWLFSQFAWVSSEINTSTGFMSLSIFQEASLPSFFPSGLCAEGTRQCLMEFLRGGVIYLIPLLADSQSWSDSMWFYFRQEYFLTGSVVFH